MDETDLVSACMQRQTEVLVEREVKDEHMGQEALQIMWHHSPGS